MKLQLYPRQEECLQAWFSHQGRGIVNVVTGAGKTVMALSGMERLSHTSPLPLRVKIIVPQTFLTSQWSKAMQKLAGIPRRDIGFYYGTHKDSPNRPYMIYVVNSARYSLSRHILQDIHNGYAVLLIADECHHYASPENRRIFEFLPHLGKEKKNFYSLGLSATPQTMDYESCLVPSLGPEIYRYTFEDAAAQKNIRPFACFHISLRFTPEESSEYEELSDRLNLSVQRLLDHSPCLKKLEGSQFFHALKRLSHASRCPEPARMAQSVLSLLYQRKSIIYNATSRIQCALRLVEEAAPDSRILIFGERIAQADLLYTELDQKYPGQADRYHSQMDPETAKAALDRYRIGETRILVTCRALDEGFDIPSANIGIVLSSSSAERQRIQRLGRILRNTEGSSIAGLYYLYVQHSSERPDYMERSQLGSAVSFFLSYDSASGQFCHPVYEELTCLVLESLKKQGKPQTVVNECRRCLSLGMLRPDWLMDVQDITSRINAAESVRDQNYWICMKLIALQKYHSINFSKSPRNNSSANQD